jgi:tetratricopeptide (TPR) repeat protein
MQNLPETILDFFAREAKNFLILILFAGFIYIWVRLSEKENYYRWLLRINPKDAETHCSLASLLEKDPHRRDEAEQEYREAIRLRPNYGWAYYSLYYVQAKERKFAEAQETWRK